MPSEAEIEAGLSALWDQYERNGELDRECARAALEAAEAVRAVSPPEEPAEGYAVMRSGHYGIPTRGNALARAVELDEKEPHFAPHRVVRLVPPSQEPPNAE